LSHNAFDMRSLVRVLSVNWRSFERDVDTLVKDTVLILLQFECGSADTREKA